MSNEAAPEPNEITPAGFVQAEPAEPAQGCHPETIPDEWGTHGPNQAIDGADRKERCLWLHGTTNKSGVARRFGSVEKDQA